MATFEELSAGARVQGLIPGAIAKIETVTPHGPDVVTIAYRDERTGHLTERVLFREEADAITVVEGATPWAFDGDGARFRLAAEAQRIRMAYLFDPMLAVHTSNVVPLPHQLAAVYESMLPRQPLRFLLADDPGAGKTIMAGLLIRELMLRGDLERCLIVTPANLSEQWQEELSDKFGLEFKIIGRQDIEASVSNNPFREFNLAIARIDLLKQDDNMARLRGADDWDLVVVDEAHKMSATYDRHDIKRTARFKLGELLGQKTRHYLLMTATPHRGRDEDFQLFLSLLDSDRFEGRVRDSTRQVDTSDLMRRMLKEDLVDFDGKPLFPERRAYTVNYELSDEEAELYEAVTQYVREEMNRADRLPGKDGERRRVVVGFALTVVQRRLASSPAAIHESLKRRLNRLEQRLEEARQTRRVAETRARAADELAPLEIPEGALNLEDLEDDLDEEPESETESIVDYASAAQTVQELEAEIASLRRLTQMAARLRKSGVDRKWDTLRDVLENPEMFETGGGRRKLVIFTEHRDTLNYLVERIGTLLGRPDAVVAIHGALNRDERRKAQARFTNEPDVLVLVATDAAGEGVNLQRAHLMVNYDLPWNPNRIEQRFGRIHRFGQREVCHVWNLVAYQTREGAVFRRLFEKLEAEREALQGKVFDVLGSILTEVNLRELILEAIRYNSTDEARSRLDQVIEQRWDPALMKRLVEERALDRVVLDAERLRGIRDAMERAEARRLVPYFIQSFFVDAFTLLGGTCVEREPGRFHIPHVPIEIRRRDRIIGRADPVTRAYERICFDKARRDVPGKPPAVFVAPGHPLLDAVVDEVLERFGSVLERGTILVDDAEEAAPPRVLFSVQGEITDGLPGKADGDRRVISRRVDYLEVDRDGAVRSAGPAPYLDYRPPGPEELPRARELLAEQWSGFDVEKAAQEYALVHLTRRHVEEVRAERLPLVEKTRTQVRQRLTAEIRYWDSRAQRLREEEAAGKKTRLSSDNARRRAEELELRLQKRLAELDAEAAIAAATPLVRGAALVLPAALLAPGAEAASLDGPARATAAIEAVAMAYVLEQERRAGREPVDVSRDNRGWDIESREPDGSLRFIEVKGRRAGQETVCVTRNELFTCLNKRDRYYLAIVVVDGERVVDYLYLRDPLQGDWAFALTSQNLELDKLRTQAAGTTA
ncbi:MAG: helicase-related protein [Tepidiforma sp.]|nr:helicase-related protein [Tepidiforma sp.]